MVAYRTWFLTLILQVGGKKYPQTDLLIAISKRLGVKRNALVTFPKYVWAMKWHYRYPGKSIIIHNSKMAASKPDIRKKYGDSTHHPLYLCFYAI